MLGSVYILHHSQPRAERRVRGPGGLGAEFSRDPGPEERERVTGGANLTPVSFRRSGQGWPLTTQVSVQGSPPPGSSP